MGSFYTMGYHVCQCCANCRHNAGPVTGIPGREVFCALSGLAHDDAYECDSYCFSVARFLGWENTVEGGK